MNAKDILDLAGALGFPGAAAALIVSFYFGLRTWQVLHWDGKKERRRGTMHRKEIEMLMENRELILGEVRSVIHGIRDELAVFGGNLSNGMDKGFSRMESRLDSLERAVRERRS